MIKIIPYLLLPVLAIFSVTPALSESVNLIDINELIAEIDALSDNEEFEKSLEVCKAAYKLDETNFEIVWRLAKAYTGVGFISNDKKGVMEKYLNRAFFYANQAIKMRPDRPEGHLRLAIVLGCYISIRGGKEKVNLAKKVKHALETAIETDPDYYFAYFGLGLWHREIAGLSSFLKFFAKVLYGKIPEGTYEDALSNMKKCLEIKNDYIEVWYELGVTYMEISDWNNAKSAFEKCLMFTPKAPSEKEYQKKARKQLPAVRKKIN